MSSTNSQSLGSSLADVSILLVEDNADEREMLEFVLTREGARVIAVGTVREALAAIAASLPDAIVSDITLPEVDGHRFMRELRSLGPECGGTIPAIAVTGWGDAEDRARSIDSGFQLHLAKPVQIETLVAVLVTLVTASR